MATLTIKYTFPQAESSLIPSLEDVVMEVEMSKQPPPKKGATFKDLKGLMKGHFDDEFFECLKDIRCWDEDIN